jgi:hypothetical protein
VENCKKGISNPEAFSVNLICYLLVQSSNCV